MNLSTPTMGLIILAALLFSLLTGTVIALLYWHSHRSDPAAVLLRGLCATGATFVGAFAVIGVVTMLV